MPSLRASSVENLALAPVSSTETVRSSPFAVSAGSTAFFRSSAATPVPLTAATTCGRPLTRRTVASLGLTSSTFLTAGSALLRSSPASRTGTRVEFSAAKVSDSAIMHRADREGAGPARLDLDRRRHRRLGDVLPDLVGLVVGDLRLDDLGRQLDRRGRPPGSRPRWPWRPPAARTVTPGCALRLLDLRAVVRQRRVLRRLVGLLGQALRRRASSLASSTTTVALVAEPPVSTRMIWRGSKLRPPPAASTLAA